MSFIEHSLDAVPINMKDIIWDLTDLMELLDLADETRDWAEV